MQRLPTVLDLTVEAQMDALGELHDAETCLLHGRLRSACRHLHAAECDVKAANQYAESLVKNSTAA